MSSVQNLACQFFQYNNWCTYASLKSSREMDTFLFSTYAIVNRLKLQSESHTTNVDAYEERNTPEEKKIIS